MPYGVSWDDLNAIRSETLESGYAGVYRKRRSWQSKCPWTKSPIAVRRNPVEAAADVVLWWRGRFGSQWRDVFAARHLPVFEVARTRRGRYRATAYVEGVAEPVPGLFAAAADARAACRAFAAALGPYARWVLRRGGTPLYTRPARRRRRIN